MRQVSLWTWRQSTPNHHAATLHGMCIEVRRSPRWRKLGHAQPWEIILFGNHFCGLPTFEHVDDAKERAEEEARRRVLALAGLFDTTTKE